MIKYTNRLFSDIIGWDVLNWSKCIEFWENNMTIDLSCSRALEVGAGNGERPCGGLTLWLALNDSRVVWSNISGPSDNTKQIHAAYGVSSLIEYQTINALSIPYYDAFDIIAFKSVLGGIGRGNDLHVQKQVLDQMYNALRPGGELLFAENLQSTKMHMSLRNKYGAAKNAWKYFTISEMLDLLKPFQTIKYITNGFLGCFGRDEKQRQLLGLLDKSIFNYFVKQNWKYIMIGIAKK